MSLRRNDAFAVEAVISKNNYPMLIRRLHFNEVFHQALIQFMEVLPSEVSVGSPLIVHMGQKIKKRTIDQKALRRPGHKEQVLNQIWL